MSLWKELSETLNKSLEKTESQKAAEAAPVSYEPLTDAQMNALKFKNLYNSKGQYKKP